MIKCTIHYTVRECEGGKLTGRTARTYADCDFADDVTLVQVVEHVGLNDHTYPYSEITVNSIKFR